MEQSLQSIKIELIQWLSTLNDPKMIQKLLEFRNEQSKDWWPGLSEKERKSIDQGLKDAKEGKLTPHSEIRKMYGEWL